MKPDWEPDMLILPVKMGEPIVINNIYVSLLGIHRNGIRLGLQSQASISIHRKEASPQHVVPEDDESCNTIN